MKVYRDIVDSAVITGLIYHIAFARERRTSPFTKSKIILDTHRHRATMSATKTSAGQRAERIQQEAVKLSAEEAANQKVLQHFAKTVYFNDLWASFLSKMAGLVVLMSFMQLQRMHQSPRGISFVAGFEVLSVLIGVATVLYVRRWLNPLLAFKVAFAFTLLQGFWFAASCSSRLMDKPRQAGDLLAEQFPFGLIYFVVCWVSDRFMVRSQETAKQTAEEMRAVLKGKTA
jgi:hypothetical protein